MSPLGIVTIGGFEFLVSVSDPGRAFPRPVPLPAPAPEPVERAGATP